MKTRLLALLLGLLPFIISSLILLIPTKIVTDVLVGLACLCFIYFFGYFLLINLYQMRGKEIDGLIKDMLFWIKED